MKYLSEPKIDGIDLNFDMPMGWIKDFNKAIKGLEEENKEFTYFKKYTKEILKMQEDEKGEKYKGKENYKNEFGFIRLGTIIYISIRGYKFQQRKALSEIRVYLSYLAKMGIDVRITRIDIQRMFEGKLDGPLRDLKKQGYWIKNLEGHLQDNLITRNRQENLACIFKSTSLYITCYSKENEKKDMKKKLKDKRVSKKNKEVIKNKLRYLKYKYFQKNRMEIRIRNRQLLKEIKLQLLSRDKDEKVIKEILNYVYEKYPLQNSKQNKKSKKYQKFFKEF